MDDKNKDLISASNPLFKKENVELNSIFEWVLYDCLTLSLMGDGLEVLVVWEFAKANKLNKIWLLRYLKVSYGKYLEE